jgi:hypothetical protein
MVLATGGVADDLRVAPAQAAEMIGKGNTRQACRSGRTTTLANRDVILNPNRQWSDFPALTFENFSIGCQDEMILQRLANFLVASGCVNRKVGSWAGMNADVQIKRQGGGVKGRA